MDEQGCPNKGEDYIEYLRDRDAAQKEVRRAKRNYEKLISEECKKNPKAFWRYYNSRTKKKQGVHHTLRDQDGNLLDSDEGKANCLNDFFAAVFTVEDTTNVPTMPNRHLLHHMNPLVVHQDTVLKELNKLNVNKAEGPDGIHPRLLFELRELLAEPLTIMFNKSLQEGRIPTEWKVAEVVPIFKKGAREEPNNYRPVSLTPIICKVLERIIKVHIMSHLEINDLLSDSQHGFRQGKNCITNLLESLESCLNCLENRSTMDVFYLDYSKAFDRVPHVRLLSKLKSYGINDKLLEWIRSFLSDRRQTVKLGGAKSTYKNVTSGVPQGSVLGPLLFILYVNDQASELESEEQMFADDAKVLGEANCQEDEVRNQRDIDTLCNWTTVWQMDYNQTKCEHLRMGNRPLISQYHLTNKDGNIYPIKTVDAVKDLGIIIDNKLSFDSHINEMTKKANGIVATFKRTFSQITPTVFSNIFKSLVRPHLEYGEEIWNPSKNTASDKIEKVQRRATKLVKGLRNLPYDQRLKVLKLPTLRTRRCRGDLITIYKITRGFLRTRLEVPYSTNRSLRGHPLKLEKGRFRTTQRLNFLTYRVIDL